MHKVVVGLERRSLVERVPGGGRLLSARITERGSALLVDVEKVRLRVENDFLAPLSPADRPEFVRMLTELCGNSPDQNESNASES